jgi:hypothetical protein
LPDALGEKLRAERGLAGTARSADEKRAPLDRAAAEQFVHAGHARRDQPLDRAPFRPLDRLDHPREHAKSRIRDAEGVQARL